jgi:uncharacterized protein (DUF2141 family)
LPKVHRSFILCFLLASGVCMAPPATSQTRSSPAPADAQSASLRIVVSGLRNAKGRVVVWLWNKPDGFARDNDKAFRMVSIDAATAVDGRVTAQWSIPSGVYAATTLHDENSNGKLDMNFLGIPTEGFGVSNNVMTMGPPAFHDAQFAVPAAASNIAIKVRYF